MRLAIKGQHMVFTEGEHVDVLYDDHLVVFLGEECIAQHLMRILLIAPREHLHGHCHAHRCLLKSLSVRVLA